jgi:Prolyl oligopeptidase family
VRRPQVRVRVRVPGPIRALIQSGAFYLDTWRRFLRPSSEGIPSGRPTPGFAGHVLLDEMLLTGFRTVHRGDTELAPHAMGEITGAVEMFDDAGWLSTPTSFHLAPPPPDASATTIRRVRSMQHTYERLIFESGYEPHADEPGRERWLSYSGNHQATAWILRHDEPRPWLVSIHGAQMGRPNIDLTILRARWLHQELGLNVALPVLPLHGPRRPGAPKGTSFPGPDVLDNIHGASQSVWDVRRLIAWIRAQDPDAAVGITGVSLGGYVSSLVAGLDPDLACAILGVPVVDLVSLMEHHTPPDLKSRWLGALEPARHISRVVSPLATQPLVPLERRFVYAGLADRIIHPHLQIMRLWEHWSRPEIHWYEGGHTLFFRSNSSARFLQTALTQSGLIEAPEAPGDYPLAAGT